MDSNKAIGMSHARASSLIAAFVICAILNIATDMTVAQVPGVGDIANTVIDVFLEIIQIGIIYQFSKFGIKYFPK